MGGRHGSQGGTERGGIRGSECQQTRCEAANMLCLTRPSDARIRQFLERQRGRPYSYPDAGASLGEPPAGYVLDHHRVRLGEGPRTFDLALAALRGWAMFRVGWV